MHAPQPLETPGMLPAGKVATAWNAAVLAVTLAFCIWVLMLIVSVSRIRRQVSDGVGAATQISRIEPLVRTAAESLIRSDPASRRSLARDELQARLDSIHRRLDTDPAMRALIANEIDNLKSLAPALDSLRVALSAAPEPGVAREASIRRARSIEARASELSSTGTRKVRAHLSALSVALGGRWTQLSIVAAVSVLLAIGSTLLLMAYVRALAAGKRALEALRHSLSEVKQLRGILPICSYCRRIRDDKDYWLQLESYVAQHTDAQFSHGVCPSCFTDRMLPEFERKPTG